MTRQKLLMRQLLTTGVAVTATLTLSAPVLAEDADGIDMVDGPQCDVVFAVNDKALNDSQIVFMGGDGTGVTPLGVEYPGYDLEAMDIDANNVLYAASGDDTANQGHLYKVNKTTAALTDLGALCVREADGISFDLTTNTLYGWGQDQGIFKVLRDANGEIDPDTCEIVLPGTGEIEDLTWNNDGTILYGVGNISEGDPDASNDDDKPRGVLVQYAPLTGEVNFPCGEVMEGLPEIEGMEMQPDGSLMFSYHDQNKVSVYGYIDPQSCMLYTGVDEPNPTPYNDIEALACCVDQGPEVEWTYQADYVGDATGLNALEIYGMAVEIEGGVMTVAINANMGPGGTSNFSGLSSNTINKIADRHVSFSDLVLDFSGTKYAVKFTTDNDSGVTEQGLYESITLKDVTEENAGWPSFKAYSNYIGGKGDLGKLALQNDYFSWYAARSVPMSIKTGTKVGDITALSATQLANMGLNFTGNGISGGTYTFGFSFQMTEEMDGEFLAYFFTECLNDGMAIKVTPEGSC